MAIMRKKKLAPVQAPVEDTPKKKRGRPAKKSEPVAGPVANPAEDFVGLMKALDETYSAVKIDAEKFIEKGNASAGKRVRAYMQDLKNIASAVRKSVMEVKASK